MLSECLLLRELGRKEGRGADRKDDLKRQEKWQVMMMKRRIGQEEKWGARKDLPLLTVQSSGLDRRHVITWATHFKVVVFVYEHAGGQAACFDKQHE